MKIKTWRNPYDNGTNLTTPKEIELKEGLTVLVGCNGAGKTTLIKNIESVLKEEKEPVCIFDNLHEGSSTISSILSGYSQFKTDTLEVGASLWTASEGEAIKINVGRHSSLYKEFLETGFFKDRNYDLTRIFDEKTEEKSASKKRVFLFDATDSGMSIDSIIEIKNLFSAIIEDAKKLNVECYIIISANEYELCRNENCFDVNAGKYIAFKDYEDYRNFIIKSRAEKEKRIEKEIEHSRKELKKAKLKLEKLKERNNEIINKIKETAKKEDRELTFREKHNIEDLEYEIKTFIRNNGL